MARRELAKRIRDLAPDTRTGGDPNPSHRSQLEQIDGRLRNHEVTIPEEHVDPTPDRDQEPLTIEPTTADDPTDTVDELEVLLLGRDLRPSGLDQPFPEF